MTTQSIPRQPVNNQNATQPHRKASYTNAVLDTAIVLINGNKLDLKELGIADNDYRSGYVEGLGKAIEIITKLKEE